MMRRSFYLLRAGWLAGLCLAGAAMTSRADLISDWNAQALAAIRTETQEVPEAARALAMLNAAIYNAVEGIAGDHFLYTTGSYTGPAETAVNGASMEAAAASAAFTLLQGLYPSLTGDFAALYSAQLSGMADDQARLDGMDFGTVVANGILNWRTGDGSAGAGNTALYTPAPGGTVGRWQPTVANGEVLPGWGAVTTFGIASTAGYTGSLPATIESYIQSAQYEADYNQVKALGSSSSGTRSPDQLNAALFWAAAAGTGTTAGLWNQVAQTVAASEGLDLQDSARLFAALNVAMADAAIVTWDTKYDVDFWSPLLAIVNGAADGNVDTLGDAAWTALLAELNSPAYFSEQSALSAAAARVLAEFLGDDVAFVLESDVDGDGVADFTRPFDSFSQAAEEAGMSQIWGGVSYGSAHADAAAAGSAVGDYVVGNYFAPVPEPSGLMLVLVGGVAWAMRRRRC